MRLKAKQYLGGTLWQRRGVGVSLTLSSYRPWQTAPWHVHANPTVFLLISGAHRDHWLKNELDQSPMSMVYHPTTEPHATSVGPSGMVGLNIEFEHSWLDRHALEPTGLRMCRMLGSAPWRLRALRLLVGVLTKPANALDDLESPSIEFLESITPFRAEHDSRPKWLSRVEELIHAHYRSPLPVTRIAEEASVHPVYLARVFRRHHGCSVSEYVRAMRLAEAGQLILHGRPLADAAAESGFYDQAHLSRWFSRKLGLSPATLQKTRKALEF